MSTRLPWTMRLDPERGAAGAYPQHEPVSAFARCDDLAELIAPPTPHTTKPDAHSHCGPGANDRPLVGPCQGGRTAGQVQAKQRDAEHDGCPAHCAGCPNSERPGQVRLLLAQDEERECREPGIPRRSVARRTRRRRPSHRPSRAPRCTRKTSSHRVPHGCRRARRRPSAWRKPTRRRSGR